jgi:thiamine-monophosphate kinase
MPLNETEKLAQIVCPLFAEDDGVKVELDNGSTATNILGVSDQDDCSAYSLSGEQTLVFGSDYVRGPKFSLYENGHIGNYDIGWYLAGANLSDIAAMGAKPLGLTSVVRYPREMPENEFAQVMRGIRDCCREHGTQNVGGDIGTAERLILCGSAIGVVEPGGLLRRSRAAPGQVVILTGSTGLAGAAMKYGSRYTPEQSEQCSEFQRLITKWRRVQPRFGHARILSRFGAEVGACVDTSDGLRGALEEVCKRSSVGIVIEDSLVPRDPGVELLAGILGLDVLETIFGDSVDFELLATVSEQAWPLIREALQSEGLAVHMIGTVIEGDTSKLQANGMLSSIPGTAWRH